MNNVHQAVTEVNTTATAQYREGFQNYIEGRSLRTCRNEWQKKGWWAALQAESDAETATYLNKAGR